MSQRKKGVLSLQGNCCNTDDSIVGKPSAEIKRKKAVKDVTSVRDAKRSKILQKVGQPKMSQWVLPSFESFTDESVSELFSVTSGGKSQQRKNRTAEKINVQDKVKPFAESTKLWCDKYFPSSEVDLAVHKKKVAEVRDWLTSYLHSELKGGVLLLTGPPGAGKTATLKVLAKEIGAEIKEWINPLNPTFQNDFVESSSRNYMDMARPVSQLQEFRNFFLRSNKYLSIDCSATQRSKTITLVEDLPNMFYRSPGQLHDILRSQLRSNRNPVVFIVSDSNSSDTNAYRLFPKDVIETLGISSISFNPVAATSLNRVANRIVLNEAKEGASSFHTPSKEVIDSLVSGCNGDIRGMVNNLQFFCLQGSTTFQQQKRLKRSHFSRGSKSQSDKNTRKKSGENECSSLSAIGGKDSSLFLFRVLGKILYCKREENNGISTSSLPAHLKHHERRPLLENPENVFEKSNMSGENLTLYLHQNYLDFFNDVDDVSAASDYLSDADHLTAEWMHRSSLSCYTSCLAIRGLMFCNQGRGNAQGKGGWRPLHKPYWYTVFKQRRKNIATAMELFHDFARNAVQLQCEILPYLALSDVALRSPGQITYLQTVRKFSKYKSGLSDTSGTLQEKEIDGEEPDLSCLQGQVTQERVVHANEVFQVTQANEDYDIEEFEDD